MSRQVIISILSSDRPGIIAGVTEAIYELDGDLADLRQSVLRGYFNMTVISRFNKDVSIAEILEKIQLMNPDSELELTAEVIPDDAVDKPLPAIENTYIKWGGRIPAPVHSLKN